MSDMTFIGWQRHPARQASPLIGRNLPGAMLRAALRRPVHTASVLLFLLVGLVATDAILAPDRARPQPSIPDASVPAKPTASPWLNVVKPIEIFSLEASEFAKVARAYKTRRNGDGGGRQDTIALGMPGAEPALRLSLYRRGSEPYLQVPFFTEIARQAADAGLSVARSGLPDLLPTRFGAFEVADVSLSTGGAGTLPCAGYRLLLDTPALTITGLACGGTAATSRAGLRCVLERLDLASGGSDRALIDFFAASELRRSVACVGMRLAPDQLHPAWLDDRSATPRRNTRRR